MQQTNDDVTFALAAKSDQLNAIDIQGFEPVLKVRAVNVLSSDQPVSIYYEGDNNKPWKPSKGMLRILAAAWGTKSSAWIGRSAQVFMNPNVIYAGKKVGGIQIRALSHIERDMSFMLTINRQKREPYPVKRLDIATGEYPSERFSQALPSMVSKMQSGEMTLQQIVAQCQKTGTLTNEQLKQLEQNAPVELDENHDNEEH